MSPSRRTPLLSEPGLLLAVYTLFSGAGFYSQLSKDGKETAIEAARLLQLASSGNDIDTAYAKRLAFALLEAVLQTQLGIFFAANLAAGCYAGFTLVTKTLFLGQLTASETSQLSERLLKFAVLKVAFLAVVHSPGHGSVMQWLAWCAVSCWLSMFTKLASLRGDALLSSPCATVAQHCRILLLLMGILAQDLSWIAGFLRSARGMEGGSLSLAFLWLFDALFVAVDASYAIVKYGVQAVDHYQSLQAEAKGKVREPWQGRIVVVYWLDVAADLTLHTLTLCHYLHLWWLHGFQLQLIDGVLFLDVRLLLGAIHYRVRRHFAYRRLNHHLQHSFADASAQQLAGNSCCICLDSMVAGKQLPCGHVMHASCLLAWLQQHAMPGTCPLCRMSLDAQQRRETKPCCEQQGLHVASNKARVSGTACRGHGSHRRTNPSSVSLEVGADDQQPGSRASLRPFTRLQARLQAATEVVCPSCS